MNFFFVISIKFWNGPFLAWKNCHSSTSTAKPFNHQKEFIHDYSTYEKHAYNTKFNKPVDT